MIRIVILPRGHVVVGKWAEDGNWVSLEGASVVRRWGTSKGLGQLAENGPQSSTILDPTPKQRFPVSTVINTIECDAAKWKEHTSH